MLDYAAAAPVRSGEMAALIRGYDWAGTSLGPMSAWPVHLRCAVDIILPARAQIVMFCGPEFVAVYNDAYVPTIGTKHPAALGRPARENWGELWDDLEPLLRRVLETGETIVAKNRPFYIERGRGPETVYFDISYSPVPDEAGHVIAVLCVVDETTDRVGYEADLQRLASIISSSEDAILGIDLDMVVTDWNDGAEHLYGYAAEEIMGKSVTVLIPGDRLDEEKCIIDRIKAGHRVEPHETVRRHKSGRLVEVSLSVSPIVAPDGRIVGASKIARDITARKDAERVQGVLVAELNHRVKNVLATVLAIARQTFGSATDIEPAKATFDARLQNFAKAHDLLTHGNWESASLAKVVEEALSPYSGSHFDIDGPDLNLPPKGVVAIALILHELATNAAKYGALSVQSGRVSLNWMTDPTDSTRFRLCWRESGGPEVASPLRRGFGSRLIEGLASGQLQGSVEIRYDPAGVRCDIHAPLASNWLDDDHHL
ncbi:sensor histidine kinase [Mycoplana dimorpha]|uniref:Blue-light-activated histidine kinase n=1 Tax=Mycoplana dimorpha TaxID=28320 RepID=A0A2T5BF06_MYCDI|nr:PAS domain S-box protein [Mycoplana dimorpha]PTM97574.1 PAS domain S-box-containing protein [Mycoplana dimorpha]